MLHIILLKLLNYKYVNYWFPSLIHLFVTLPLTIIYVIISASNRIFSKPDDITNISADKLIVFVHGRGGHFSNFDTLIKNMSVENYGKFRVNLGKTSYTSIREDSQNLYNQLLKSDSREIILVGLSKGGLIVMDYLTNFSDKRISKVITISSPLKGTKIANMTPDDSIPYTELSYQSKICKKIEKRAAKYYDIIYHITPAWDHMIQPLDSSYYDFTPKDHVYHFTQYNGHIGIIGSKKVSDVISNFILDN